MAQLCRLDRFSGSGSQAEIFSDVCTKKSEGSDRLHTVPVEVKWVGVCPVLLSLSLLFFIG